jgi:DNA polymerase III subunit epsilon
MLTFVALDFETASFARDSACEIGLVRVEDGRVTAEETRFIRPPSKQFNFTYLHGIDWEMVKDAPSFGELMPEISRLFEGADFLAAHYAPFDKGVMANTCARYRLPPPPQPYVCTVRLARAVWNIHPTKLNNVCDALGLELGRHHRAGHDALACAGIVMKGIAEIGENAFRARHLKAG